MLYNTSPWQAITVENFSIKQKKCTTIIVKQSFDFTAQGEVMASAAPVPIIQADEYVADPTSSSLKNVNETAPFKQGFELYAQSTAYPPKDKEVSVVEVNVTLQEKPVNASSSTTSNSSAMPQTLINKTLRVTGERVWKRSLLGSVASTPQTLTATAIQYEQAFGGIDSKKATKYCSQNPIGRGFNLHSNEIIASALPSIEYPYDTLRKAKDSISVAGFGAIAPSWQPRLDLMPELDQEKLMQGRYPYSKSLPANAYNVAPHDQQIAQTLNSAQSWQCIIKGLLPNLAYQHPVVLTIPAKVPQLTVIQGEHQYSATLICDTLVLNSDDNQFHLLWRTSIDNSDLGDSPKFIVQEMPKPLNAQVGVQQDTQLTAQKAIKEPQEVRA